VPEAAADSGHCRSVQFRRQPDTTRAGGVRGGQRPSGQHLVALPGRTVDTAAVSGSVDTCWVPDRSAPPADTDSPEVWTADAACGHWQPAGVSGAADTRDGGRVVQAYGNATLDSRQRNRPLPLACPAGNGTARCGIGQHRHGQTARSVVWGRPET
jgi:hypothetical protein